jgi:hypothetical protein
MILGPGDLYPPEDLPPRRFPGLGSEVEDGVAGLGQQIQRGEYARQMLLAVTEVVH